MHIFQRAKLFSRRRRRRRWNVDMDSCREKWVAPRRREWVSSVPLEWGSEEDRKAYNGANDCSKFEQEGAQWMHEIVRMQSTYSCRDYIENNAQHRNDGNANNRKCTKHVLFKQQIIFHTKTSHVKYENDKTLWPKS